MNVVLAALGRGTATCEMQAALVPSQQLDAEGETYFGEGGKLLVDTCGCT